MMQTELMYRDTRMSRAQLKQEARDSRETIHSGHFMVSDFEAEAQDDEDELAVPVPEEEAARLAIIAPPGFSLEKFVASSASARNSSQQLSIETSLNKLFQCMSLAYRQKLTSPKWNRFKGIRLRWKDKIRLNNVIWRCWHMQFILKQNTLVCQFASPLDVGTHNKPEAVVLEGKYWKRKLEAVKAEYKKWRMFYRNKTYGCSNKDGSDMLESMDTLEWDGDMESFTLFGIGAGSSYSGSSGTAGDNMMVDEDYRDLIHDTLFTTISSNQPMYFPNSREIVRGATIADFMQPSLGPLQPNLDDFMDNLEPLHEFLSGSSKLAPVPEEEVFHNPPQLSSSYPDLNLMLPMNQLSAITATDSMTGAVTTTTTTDIRQQQESASQQMQTEDSSIDLRNLQYTAKIFTQPQQSSTAAYRNNVDTFNQIQQNYEQQLQQQTQPVREKQNRQSRSALRTSRLAQQQQQQQQAVFQSVVQQQQQQRQLSAFTVPQRNYSMEIQNSHLSVGTGQLQLPLPDPSSQMQTLLNQQQQTFGSTEVQHHQQVQSPQVQKQMKSNLSCKPYSKIPSQGYKFSSPTPNFDAQQCKFTSNNIKMLPAQQQQQQSQPVVATTVSTQQSGQPQHVLLQCKPPAGIDLTAPALHPTKLLPRPAVTAIQPQPAVTAAAVEVKQEVFAVPKYQMKAKSRSRSSSSLNAPRMHPPPLVSAVSDPALNLNNNVLLAHLLTSNTSSVYGVNPDKASTSQTQSVIGVKHILPMLTSGTQVTNASHLMNAPVTTVLAASNIQNQGQQQLQNSLQQPSTSQGILLNTTVQSQNSNPNSPKDSSAHSPQAVSLSPLHSPMSLGSPLSPNRGYIKPDSEQRQGQYKEQRRVGHIHAEQKRRYNIKNGFDLLYSLIPQLSQNPNTKMSKAAMLQKGADYITILRAERQQLKEEMDNLRSQIDSLHADISNCQAMLPATGAPVSRQRTSKMKEMFDDYVRVRTRDNWKFWIFSILLEPLMLSFNTSVSTASVEDLYRTTQLWVEQHCSLVDLRPAVLHSLRRLCTTTDILHDPSRLPEEALAAVNKTEQKKSTQ